MGIHFIHHSCLKHLGLIVLPFHGSALIKRSQLVKPCPSKRSNDVLHLFCLRNLYLGSLELQRRTKLGTHEYTSILFFPSGLFKLFIFDTGGWIVWIACKARSDGWIHMHGTGGWGTGGLFLEREIPFGVYE